MELSELWAVWTSWCEESNETLGNQPRFADRLTERTIDEVHGTNNMAIRRGSRCGMTEPGPLQD